MSDFKPKSGFLGFLNKAFDLDFCSGIEISFILYTIYLMPASADCNFSYDCNYSGYCYLI